MSTTNTHSSSEWRLNRSTQPAIEYANAIKALSKVVGLLDQRTTSVAFNTKGSFSYNDGDSHTIRIDPRHAKKGTPIPESDFDVLVGLTVHEAMHTKANSHSIEVDYSGLATGLISPQTIAAAAEEIYCDHLARRHHPVAFSYLRKARASYKADFKPDWSNVIGAYVAVSVYGVLPPADTPTRTLHAMKILSALTVNLSRKDYTELQRIRMYRDAAQDLAQIAGQIELEKKLRIKNTGADEGEDWSSLDEDSVLGAGGSSDDADSNEGSTNEPPVEEDSPKSPSGDDTEKEPDSDEHQESEEGLEDQPSSDAQSKSPDDQITDEWFPDESQPTVTDPSSDSSSSGDDSTADSTDDSTADSPLAQSLTMDSGERISKALEREIQQAIDTDQKDLLDELKTLDGFDSVGVRSVKYERPAPDPETHFDESLYKQLVWIAMLRNAASRVTYRGQDSGRIDGRRLYRAKIDHKPFKVNRRLPLEKNKLVLVLDASSSMALRSWTRKLDGSTSRTVNPVYLAAAAIHKAIPDVVVYSYSAGYGTGGRSININEHSSHGRQFDKVIPNGGTPSGVAILSAAMRNPDALLVHFTDGFSNIGLSPKDAWAIVDKEFPKVKLIDIRYDSGGINHREGDPVEPGPKVSIIEIDDLESFGKTLRDAIKPWYLQL